MKKNIIFLFLILSLLFLNLNGDTINSNPRQVFPGTQVNFVLQVSPDAANNFVYKWNFGDGTPPVSGQQLTVIHTYAEPGNYSITCEKRSSSANSQPTILTANITVVERRTVSPKGKIFTVNNPVLFETNHFLSDTLKWDFGDGTVNDGQKSREHIFKNPGNYTIKVKDNGGRSPSVISCNIIIAPDRREIQVQPRSANVGQKVVIKLINSTSNSVTWKIGNDNPVNSSNGEIQYVFKDPGEFNIVADVQGQTPIKATVMISDRRSISVENRYIFNGSNVRFVTKNFNSPSLKWDFGDGMIISGGGRLNHKYMRQGTYTIKVFDFNGKSNIPVKLRINVKNDKRKILIHKKTVIAGSETELEAINFFDNRIKWDFGDGTSRMGKRITTHTYKREGMYRLFAVDFDGHGDRKIKLTINVIKDNRVFDVVNNPIAGVPVSIRTENLGNGRYEIKFPNGKVLKVQSTNKLVFNTPGQKTITIYDKSGKFPPMTKTLIVYPDNRSLTVGTDTVIPGESLKIVANNFNGGGIKWDFGDGTPPKVLSKSISYKYSKSGIYKITAIDSSGKGIKHFTKIVRVKDQISGFKIEAIELVFSNGKYFRVVPMKSFSPEYQLRIKAKGRGIITGKWLFDGKVLGLFSKALLGRSLITLKGKELPKLPVSESGIHSLGFEFTNFKFGNKIPMLRYFVTNSGTIKIVSPRIHTKLKRTDSVLLKWDIRKPAGKFKIAVSQIPFQLLKEKSIKWIEVKRNSFYKLKMSNFRSGQWIYWQVRMIDATGTPASSSEVAFFKVF